MLTTIYYILKSALARAKFLFILPAGKDTHNILVLCVRLRTFFVRYCTLGWTSLCT